MLLGTAPEIKGDGSLIGVGSGKCICLLLGRYLCSPDPIFVEKQHQKEKMQYFKVDAKISLLWPQSIRLIVGRRDEKSANQEVFAPICCVRLQCSCIMK